MRRARPGEEILLCDAAKRMDFATLVSLLEKGVHPNVHEEVR